MGKLNRSKKITISYMNSFLDFYFRKLCNKKYLSQIDFFTFSLMKHINFNNVMVKKKIKIRRHPNNTAIIEF